MGMNKIVQNLNKLFLLTLTLLLISCAHNFTTDSYNALQVAATTYETSMSAAADLYQQGLLDEGDKEKVMEIGLKYWAAYHIAVDSLATYNATKSAEAKDKLETSLSKLNSIAATLQTYVYKEAR